MWGKLQWSKQWGSKGIAALSSTLYSSSVAVITTLSHTVSAITTAVGATHHFISSTLSDFFSSPTLGWLSNNTLEQWWEGFFPSLSPAVSGYLKSTQLRRLLNRAIVVDTNHLFLLMAQYYIVQAMLRDREETSPDYCLYPLFAMSLIGTTWMKIKTWNWTYKKAALDLSITKATPTEIQGVMQNFPPCGHEDALTMKSGSATVSEYFFTLLLLEVLAYIPIVELLNPFLFRPHVVGRSMSASKLLAANMCPEDLIKKLKYWNAYSLALGMSVGAITKTACYFLKQLIGVPEIVSYPAVESFVYTLVQYSVLMRKEKIPEHGEGLDYQYYSREILMDAKDKFFKLMNAWARLYNQSESVSKSTASGKPKKSKRASMLQIYVKLSEKIVTGLQLAQKVGHAALEITDQYFILRKLKSGTVTVAGLVAPLIFPKEWLSVENFISSTENELLMEVYGPGIKAKIQQVTDMRDKPNSEKSWTEWLHDETARKVAGLPYWMVRGLISREKKNLVNTVYHPLLGTPLSNAQKALHAVAEAQQLERSRREQVLVKHDPKSLAATPANADSEYCKERDTTPSPEKMRQQQELRAGIQAAITTKLEDSAVPERKSFSVIHSTLARERSRSPQPQMATSSTPNVGVPNDETVESLRSRRHTVAASTQPLEIVSPLVGLSLLASTAPESAAGIKVSEEPTQSVYKSRLTGMQQQS